MAELRVAVLASHEGTTAQAVMDAFRDRELAGSVVLVISNNREAGVLRRAQAAGIPWRHLSGVTHPEPDALDGAIVAALDEARPSVVVLAGYLKRLGPQTLAGARGPRPAGAADATGTWARGGLGGVQPQGTFLPASCRQWLRRRPGAARAVAEGGARVRAAT
ncbi:MAG: formyltransferase family protein [Mycobacteriales bacterium]